MHKVILMSTLLSNTMNAPCIIGWGHTAFGKHDHQTLESLMIKVSQQALEHSGIEARDIDEIVLGHFNAGLSKQDFTASLVLNAHPELRFKPATRVENACATGSAAIAQGLKTIQAGLGRIVLVVGVEHMSDVKPEDITSNLLKASYLPEDGEQHAGFAGIFADIAADYFTHFGDQSGALAKIAVKNHLNAMRNPFAHMHKELSYDFCYQPSEKNPYVAGVLKRTDCSLVSDGAAALVLCDAQTAIGRPQAVRFRAFEHVQDFLPRHHRNVLLFEGAKRAWSNAFTNSGITLKDLSCVEVHDCFTIAELLSYEAMGLTPHGQGMRAVHEGLVLRQGILPVNLSGGLKAKGHPIGATGVSMHVMNAMQVSGRAPDALQLHNATLAAAFNMGGVAVANYVSILEGIH